MHAPALVYTVMIIIIVINDHKSFIGPIVGLNYMYTVYVKTFEGENFRGSSTMCIM